MLYCFPDSSGKSLWGAISESVTFIPVISLGPILGELISEKCVKSMFPLNSTVPLVSLVKLNNLKTNKKEKVCVYACACAYVYICVRVCCMCVCCMCACCMCVCCMCVCHMCCVCACVRVCVRRHINHYHGNPNMYRITLTGEIHNTKNTTAHKRADHTAMNNPPANWYRKRSPCVSNCWWNNQ